MTAASPRKSEIRRRTPRPSRMNGEATRARILDAAEKLFAEHGYSAVSMRSITAEAGVNVAAIHFHFASKEALFEALFDRRIVPINDARIAALQATMKQAPDGRPSIEDVISAFVKPYLDAGEGFDAGRIVVLQFMARAAADHDRSIQEVIDKKFDQPWKALVKATRKAAPGITDEALHWGLFFLLGALYFVNPSRSWLTTLSDGKCNPGDTVAAGRYLLPFLAGGMRAVSKPVAGKKRPAPTGRKKAKQLKTR